MTDNTKVRLRCIEEGGQLRIRIITPGYKSDANCQFPKNIRAKDREYIVSADMIQLRKLSNKWFYSVRRNCCIEVVHRRTDHTNLKVYDVSSDECCVCFGESKDSIFAPCGHYACCKRCSELLLKTSKKCPMCRASIVDLIDYIDLT